MLRVVARVIGDSVLVALLLFSAAHTLAWPRAWILLVAMLGTRLAGALAVYRAHPALMRERAALPIHDAQPVHDRVLVLAILATGFLGLPALAGLDVFHWRLLPPPAPLLADAGLLLFVLGWSLKSLALYANAFAIPVIRPQAERAQTVVDSGPYAVVRHPFYAADPLIFIGLSFWLESSAAALGALVPLALMMRRVQLEEHFLLATLPGYSAYARRVRFRLVPGVW